MFLRLVYYNLIFVGVEVVLVGLTHEMSYTAYSIRIVTSYSIRTQTARFAGPYYEVTVQLNFAPEPQTESRRL